MTNYEHIKSMSINEMITLLLFISQETARRNLDPLTDYCEALCPYRNRNDDTCPYVDNPKVKTPCIDLMDGDELYAWLNAEMPEKTLCT